MAEETKIEGVGEGIATPTEPVLGAWEKKKVGRPTLYVPELCDRVIEFLESCKDELNVSDKGDVVVTKVKYPSIESCALFLNISRKNLYEWAEAHEEFRDTLDLVYAEQAKRLQDNALPGHYVAPIVKLLLNKHGYHDSSKVDITSKGEKIGPSDEQQAKWDALLAYTKKPDA